MGGKELGVGKAMQELTICQPREIDPLGCLAKGRGSRSSFAEQKFMKIRLPPSEENASTPFIVYES